MEGHFETQNTNKQTKKETVDPPPQLIQSWNHGESEGFLFEVAMVVVVVSTPKKTKQKREREETTKYT